MNSEQLPIGKAHCRRRIATAARLWPEPVVWTDVRELMLLAFTPGCCTNMGGQPPAKLTRAYNRRANQL
jgi:hypothetical protein